MASSDSDSESGDTSSSSTESPEAYIKVAEDEFLYKWKHPTQNNAKFDDFKRIRTLGSGAFGRVMLVQYRRNKKYYAVKILDKEKIIKMQQVEHTLNEKRVLQAIDFPFLVKLDFTFKDNSNLYIVLEFISGGEMFNYLTQVNRFPSMQKPCQTSLFTGAVKESQSKLYAAQVVLGFEYLHGLHVLYRDLKPENILIAKDGYIKAKIELDNRLDLSQIAVVDLAGPYFYHWFQPTHCLITDMGFAKRVTTRTYTMCGTPEYIAPEIIQNKGYSTSVDWWTVGILIFEMTSGYPPFQGGQHMTIYEKIIEGTYKFPKHFSSNVKDLCRNLIVHDRTRRFGNLKHGINDIKNHPWFKEINWVHVYEKRVNPPYIPQVKDPGDAANFRKQEEEPIKISSHNKYAKEFREF